MESCCTPPEQLSTAVRFAIVPQSWIAMVCAFKMQCCPHTPARQIPRDLHEDARDVARALAKTEAFKQSRPERKKVEMQFAHMKRILKLDRLRL
jgi:hypothetical protein